MRQDRFFINSKIKVGKATIVDKEIAFQLKKVLRKKRGDKIFIFNNEQTEATAKIENILNEKIDINILEIYQNKNEPFLYVRLYCSILKKNNFEWMVQKTTEIGVKEIIPLVCGNTVKLGLNSIRLRKIIKEAAEQAGRGVIPLLREPLSFQEALYSSQSSDLKIIFDKGGESINTLKSLKEIKPTNLSIFIGPEGGWKKEEIELAKKEEMKVINLGKLTLRAETAALIASFLVVNIFEIT